MIADIAEKVYAGTRLSIADGVRLLRHPNLPELAALADHVRARKHPAPVVSYILGRRIIYTNVCCVRHASSDFYRAPEAEGGYVLARDTLFEPIQELVDVGGRRTQSCQLVLQGGFNPGLRLAFVEDLLSAIRERFPFIAIDGLSPTAILYLAAISRLPVAECLVRLRAAGLDAIAASGPELLLPAVRRAIQLEAPISEWLHLHREAHRAGLRSTAAMVYGRANTVEERVSQLDDVRTLQDETRGFTAFVLCHPAAGAVAGSEHAMTGYDHLRHLAVARMFLDNIDHFEAAWDTQGEKIAQVSLQSGADDAGSLAPGHGSGPDWTGMRFADVERLIRCAGWEPTRRNARYELLN